jgi:solute carrier family 50 (sugar transporter)
VLVGLLIVTFERYVLFVCLILYLEGCHKNASQTLFLVKNLFVFFANAPGFLLSIWLNLCAVKLQYEDHHATEMRQSFTQFLESSRESMSRNKDSSGIAKENEDKEEDTPTKDKDSEKDTHTVIPNTWHTITDLGVFIRNITSETSTPAPAPQEKLLMMMFIIWTLVFSIVAFGDFTSRTRELIVGIVVNVNVVFFYGAPLSTMMTVLQQRNSASIHIRTMITNTLNSVFWAAYGIAISDTFILVPNSIGVLMGFVQIMLVLILPRHQITNKDQQDDSNIVDVNKENQVDQL